MFTKKEISEPNIETIKQRIKYLKANDPRNVTLKLLNLIVHGEQKSQFGSHMIKV